MSHGVRPHRNPCASAGAGAGPRAAAAAVVEAVRGQGRSLDEALALPQVQALADGRDRALVQELSYGTLRLLPRLEALAAALMHKPVKPGEGDLEALILVGLYQLIATRIPPHAAVAATVAAARSRAGPGPRAWSTPCCGVTSATRPISKPALARDPGHAGCSRTGCSGASRPPGRTIGRPSATPATPTPP